jgi:hypothetical protein
MSPQNLVKEGLTRKIFRNKDLGVRFQSFKVKLGLACLENVWTVSSPVIRGATGHDSIVNLLWAQSRLFVTSRQVLAMENGSAPRRSKPPATLSQGASLKEWATRRLREKMAGSRRAGTRSQNPKGSASGIPTLSQNARKDGAPGKNQELLALIVKKLGAI